MKFCYINFGLYLILLSEINFAYSKTTNTVIEVCSYTENNLEVSCDESKPKSECYSHFFGNYSQFFGSNSDNKLKVHSLKVSNCAISKPNESFYRPFRNIRVLDLSDGIINELYAMNLNLDKFSVAHNELPNLIAETFSYILNVTDLDFSFNKISSIERKSFWGLRILKILNLSNNFIQSLDKDLFKYNQKLEVLRLANNTFHQLDSLQTLTGLKHLDLRNSSLSKVKLHNLPSLESLHLENNPITRVDCTVFSLLLKSVESHITWENVRELDTSCMDDSFKIQIDKSATVIFRLQQGDLKLLYPTKHLQHLTFLNVSGNHHNNTPELIQYLGSSLETLDLSSNYVGKLNSNTLRKLINLRYLNVTNTNLSNFGLKTFLMLKKLQTLDLSNNNLKKVNFTLLWRNFKNLNTLVLEGNELSEVDSITQSNFPHLLSLGISKNRFPCEYLVTFLRQWENLQLFSNPSDDTHIDGVDCYHEDEDRPVLSGAVTTLKVAITSTKTFELERTEGTQPTLIAEITDPTDDPSEPTDAPSEPTDAPTEFASEIDSNSTETQSDDQSSTINNTTTDYLNFNSAAVTSSNSSMELRIIERLLLVLCLVCCGYLIMKSQLAQGMKEKIKSFQSRRDTEEVINDFDLLDFA